MFASIKLFIGLLLHLRCNSLGNEVVSYNGYSLFRITPMTEPHLEYLLRLSAITDGKYDFWLLTTTVNHPADMVVAPSSKQHLTKKLDAMQMPYTLLIDDLGKKIADDKAASVKTSSGLEFFGRYQDNEEINQYMDNLASSYPEHVSVLQVGISYEGRLLQVLKISASSDKVKPAIWIQAGAHAREQIGPVTVLYIAKKLASLHLQSAEITELVNTYDWYLFPVLNPDGYDYCQKTDRLWRKTRSLHPNDRNCVGVDANRNWDAAWNVAAGSSSNPCSHNYAGPSPFSEPETKCASDFMLQEVQGRLKIFLDFHSYSQRWLTPWGYSSNLPPNYEQQKRLAEAATSSLERVNGTKYSVGSTGTIFYTVTGGARDWAFDVVGAENSYVVELRDKGENGFLLPKRLILPTADETWDGVRAMTTELTRTSRLQS